MEKNGEFLNLKLTWEEAKSLQLVIAAGKNFIKPESMPRVLVENLETQLEDFTETASIHFVIDGGKKP